MKNDQESKYSTTIFKLFAYLLILGGSAFLISRIFFYDQIQGWGRQISSQYPVQVYTFGLTMFSIVLYLQCSSIKNGEERGFSVVYRIILFLVGLLYCTAKLIQTLTL